MATLKRKWALKGFIILTEFEWYFLWTATFVHTVLVIGVFSGIISARGILAEMLEAVTSTSLIFTFSSNETLQLLLVALFMYAVFAFCLFVVFQLRKAFKNLMVGKVFIAENADRFRWIAYLMLLSAVVGFQPTVLFAALVMLTIAEIFSCGIELEETQKLTI
jgi:hypothetical protein